MRTDIVKRISSERRMTKGYFPLQHSPSKMKAIFRERSKVELFNEEAKYKSMPLVELNSSKKVTWATVAGKHIIPTEDPNDKMLFEEMMLGFCQHESLLKVVNERKQVVHDNIADKSRITSFKDEEREEQKKHLSQLFLLHGLLKAGENELLRSEKPPSRRSAGITSMSNTYYTNQFKPKNSRVVQDDAYIKPKSDKTVAPFAQLLGKDLKQTKKVLTHQLLRPM